ncbi:hypothetical protein CM240_3002 [Clostridium bornimense]|uniref:Uncharacterized protein n=1 Tax=Clostridium bornimense TaxID=1216932 RepID=W6S2I6_9CLOT|nr:hypothetical protein [Clostridium bornimense]CDM70119.1 hypothetical protein CM240_3002 [Clostridium bornimense]
MNRKDELVDFINSELLDYKGVIKNKEKNYNIKNMLSNMPIINNDISSNILEEKKYDVKNEDINYHKLKLLLDNIDDILRLINKNNSNKAKSFRLGNTKVTSLRVDEGIYEQVKNKSIKDKINISEIINIALEDYLNKY